MAEVALIIASIVGFALLVHYVTRSGRFDDPEDRS